MGYERTCVGCGNEFVARNLQQIRCTKDCGRKSSTSKNHSRSVARLSNEITFIGVDGEGVDRPDGAHEYVMLSVGERTLWRDGRQLAIGEILSFLWECYQEQPDAAYIGFFLGYDFIQWEKLLPESVARSLLTNIGIAERKSSVLSRANPYPDAVVWEGWELDIMAGRRFKLRPHVHHKSAYNSLCRNRTCRKELEDVFVPNAAGEPIVIYEGEMDWVIPAGDGCGNLWEGTASAFWKAAMPRMHTVGRGRDASKASGWLYICDTGSFWQTSFLNVINPKGWPDGTAPVTQAEYDLIERGKGDRGKVADYGTAEYFDEMRLYNVLENEILARVTSRLNQGFMNDVIPIKIPKTDWYGPGRAAQLWMDMLHEKIADPGHVEANKRNGSRYVRRDDRQNEGGILNADIYMSMPEWCYEAAQSSYYGGWFEQMVHGHCGNVWEYDINSAYPFIIASLPCLHETAGHNGVYSRGKGRDYPSSNGVRYTLLHAIVEGTDPYIGGMPYRTRQGNILRPHVTEGWYWEHELLASKRAGLIDTFTVTQWVSYLPCECRPPFNPDDIGISRMYQMRLDVGKNSPQGKAAKLVYNSAYGKTAQSIGTPKYSNPFYASLITAGCRTLILDAIASHPMGSAAVSMVATDGVYFTSPHPTLELSDHVLGLWDETPKRNITQLMPGVYWDDSTREAIGLGGTPKLKSRGVNARDLARQIENLDYRFALAHKNLADGLAYDWPTITFTTDFLLDSAKAALHRGKWETAGRVTHGATRSISSNPISKRNPEAYRDVDSGLTRTRPYSVGPTTRCTTPYNKSFGYLENDGIPQLFGDTVTRDGIDPLAYWRDAIRGIST